jgi:hypothetical protein
VPKKLGDGPINVDPSKNKINGKHNHELIKYVNKSKSMCLLSLYFPPSDHLGLIWHHIVK